MQTFVAFCFFSLCHFRQWVAERTVLFGFALKDEPSETSVTAFNRIVMRYFPVSQDLLSGYRPPLQPGA
jgi:hypothetical protein